MRALGLLAMLIGGCGSDGATPPDMTDNCLAADVRDGAHCDRSLTSVCIREMITCVCQATTWSCSAPRDMATHD